jgi:phage terminase large subunit-like protein
MSYVTISTEVDVYLDDFDDDVLIKELKDRGYAIAKQAQPLANESDLLQHLQSMYVDHVLGRDINEQLRQLFWISIGRNV